jgi:hypothetical protein
MFSRFGARGGKTLPPAQIEALASAKNIPYMGRSRIGLIKCSMAAAPSWFAQNLEYSEIC